MKVLLVSAQMEKPNGGIAIWTNTYLGGIKNSEIEADIVNTAAIGARAENGNAKRNFFDEFIRTKRIFGDLKSKLKSNEYSVAHVNTSCGTFGMIRDYYLEKRIKKKHPKTKILTHFHCDIPFQVKNKITKKYLEKLLKLSDKNFVLCENSKSFLKNEFSCESIKVPNFVDKSLISHKKKEFNKSIENVFFVGRVSLSKGAEELYELARRFPTKRFELVGNVSPAVNEWQKPHNVILSGAVSHDEVLRRMDEADVFLFPTHSEGFSMALAEAMSRGLPTVTTDVGANLDMLEGIGGVVVEVGDVDAMQNAISSIEDKDIRSKMSEWCIEKVQDNYITEKVIQLFIKEYKTL